MSRGIGRRDFLKGAFAGLAGVAAGFRVGARGPSASETPRSSVVEVTGPGAMYGPRPVPEVVERMMERGVCALTGENSDENAWASLFGPGDVVGIKINATAAPRLSTTPAVVGEIIRGLKLAGVRENDILIWDIEDVGLDRARFAVNRTGEGVRCYAGDDYDREVAYESPIGTAEWLAGLMEGPTDEENLSDRLQACWRRLEVLRERGVEVKDYGERIRNAWRNRAHPDLPATAALLDEVQDVFGETRTPDDGRSFFSRVVTQEITKLINVPVLKHHGLTGVSLGLKNLALGATDNRSRFHAAVCDPMIAEVCAHPALRDKLVLHVLDGLRGCYAGGPAYTPRWWWRSHSVLLSRDPVALDRVGFEIIQEKRASEHLSSLEDENFRMLGTARSVPRHVHLATAVRLGLGTDDIDRIDRIRLAV